MTKRRRKKLLPVSTPDANTLKAIRNRIAKDIEIMEKMPSVTADRTLYPVDECRKGLEWLTWLENEKRNEEKRLAREGDSIEE